MEKNKTIITFSVKIDDMLKLKSHALDDSAFCCKDIFRISSFYYMFTYNRNGDVHTNTLREITKEEFYIRKTEMLSYQPQKLLQFWEDETNSYELRHYAHIERKWQLRAGDCLFINEDSPLKKIYEQSVNDATKLFEQSKEKEQLRKNNYAKLCGVLSVQMGIAYENVIRIGPNRSKLTQFKESMQQALIKIQSMQLTQLRQHYNNLIGLNGRPGREQALKDFGIKYFDTDTKMLNLTELEEAMKKRLENYITHSLSVAVRNGSNLNYEARKEIYQNIISASREKRKKVLSDLGVEVQAIDINRYPFPDLKRIFAATIGLNLEKYR